MFESIIIMFQKLYFVLFVLAIFCIFGIWKRKGFVVNIIMSALLSGAYGWSAWYIDNGNWWRLGEPMEGTVPYILGFLGFVIFAGAAVFLSFLKPYLRIRAGEVNWRRGVAEGIFWLSFVLAIFSFTCRRSHILPEIPYILEVSIVYIVSYPSFFLIKWIAKQAKRFYHWYRKFRYRRRVKRYQRQN